MFFEIFLGLFFAAFGAYVIERWNEFTEERIAEFEARLMCPSAFKDDE